MSRESWCPAINAADSPANPESSLFSSEVMGTKCLTSADGIKHVDCNRPGIPRRTYDDTLLVIDGAAQQAAGAGGEKVGPSASAAQQAACASYFSGQLAESTHGGKFISSYKNKSSAAIPFSGYSSSISSAVEHPSGPSNAPLLSSQTKQLLGMGSGGESGAITGATALAAQNAAINEANAASARPEQASVLGPACLAAGISGSKGIRNGGPFEANTACLTAAGSYTHKEHHIFNPQSISMAEKQEAEAGTHLYPDDIVAHRHANHLLNTNDSNVSLGVSSAEDEDDLFGSTSPRRQRSKPKSYSNKKGGALGGNGDFAYSFRPGDINGNNGNNKAEEDVMIMGGEASFSNFAIKDPRFHDSEGDAAGGDKTSKVAANNNNKNGISVPKDVSVKSLEHLLRLLILKKEGSAATTTPTSDDSTFTAEQQHQQQVGVPIKHLSINGSNGAEIPAWALSLLLGTKLVQKEVPTQKDCDATIALQQRIEGVDASMTTPREDTSAAEENNKSSLIKSPPAGSARSAVIMNYRITKETLTSIGQQEKDRATLVAQLERSIQLLLHDSLVSLDLSNGVLEPSYAPIDKQLKSLAFAKEARLEDTNGGEDVGGDLDGGEGTSPKKRGPRKSESQKASERAHRIALQLAKKDKNFYLEQLLNKDVSKRAAVTSRKSPVGDEAPMDADDDEEAFAQIVDGDAVEVETEEQEREAALFDDEAVSTAALIILRDALLPFSAKVPVEASEVESAIAAMITERNERKLRNRRERRSEARKEALREQGELDRDEVAGFDTGDVGAAAPDFDEDISPFAEEEGEEREEGEEDDDSEGNKSTPKKKSKKQNEDADIEIEEEEENDDDEEDVTLSRRKVALFKRLERSRMFVPPVLQNLQNLNLSNNPSLFLDQNTATNANRLGSTRGAFSLTESGNSLATAIVPGGTAAASRATALTGGSGAVSVFDGAAAAELGSNLVAIEALRTVLLLSSHEYKYRHCFKGFWEEVNKQSQRESAVVGVNSSVASENNNTAPAVPKSTWYHKNTLRTLLLSNTGLGTPAAIKAIAQGLKYNTSLHTLDLSRNALGGKFFLAKNGEADDDEEGTTENHGEKEEAFIGSFVNRALKCNKHLKVLDLSENGLSGKMVAALALALQNSIYSYRPKKAFPDDVEDEGEAALARIGEDDDDEQPIQNDNANDDDADMVDADGNPKNEVKYYNLKDLYNPDPLVLFSSDEDEDRYDMTSAAAGEDAEDNRRVRRWQKKYPHIFDINEWAGLDLGEADEREEAARFAEFQREKQAAIRAEEGGAAAAADEERPEEDVAAEDDEEDTTGVAASSSSSKRTLEALVTSLFDETYFPAVEDRPKMSATLPPVPEEDPEESDDSDDTDEEKAAAADAGEEEEDDEEGDEEENGDEKPDAQGEDEAAEEAEEIPEEDDETKMKRLAKELRRDERVWKKKMRYFVWIPEQLHIIHEEHTARRQNLYKDFKKELSLLKVQELFTKRNHVLKIEARRIDSEVRRSKLGWSEIQLLSLQRNPAIGNRGAIALAKALRHSVPITSEQERIHEQKKRVALLKYIIQCVVSSSKRDIRKQVTHEQEMARAANAANGSDEGTTTGTPRFDDTEIAAATDNNGENGDDSVAPEAADQGEKPFSVPPLASGGKQLEDIVSKHRNSHADYDGEEAEEDEEQEENPDNRFDDNEDGDENNQDEDAPTHKSSKVAAHVVIETEEPLQVVFDEPNSDDEGAERSVILYYFKNPIPIRTLVDEEIESHGLSSLLAPIPEGLFSNLITSLYGPGNLEGESGSSPKNEGKDDHDNEEASEGDDDEDEAPFSSPSPAKTVTAAAVDEEEEEEEDENEQKAAAKRLAAIEKRMAKLPYGDRTATRPGFRSLHHLNLEGCGIGSLGVKALAETIGNNCLSLRTLNLSQNNRFAIRRKKKSQDERDAEEAQAAQDEVDTNGDEDALKRMLMIRKANTTHQDRYDLSYVSPAMVSLSNAIMTNNTLVTLDLSFCRLYPAALMSLASGLAANRTLKHLNLRGNFLGCLENFVGPAHVKENNKRLYSPLAYLLAGLVEEATNGPCSLETLILDGNILGSPDACGLVTSNNTDFQVVGAQENSVYDASRGESTSVIEEVLAKKDSLLALDDAAATLLAHLCHSSLSTLSIANNDLRNEDLARLSNGVFELAMDKKVGGGEGSAVSELVNELLGLDRKEIPEDHKRMGGKRSSITDLVDEEESAVSAQALAAPKEEDDEGSDIEESRMLAFKKKAAGPGANAGGKPLRAAGASFCVNTTATLQSLNVGKNPRLTGEAGGTSIARMLQFMSRLEELYVDGCHGLGDKGFQLVCLKIRSHSALKILSVPRTGMTSLMPLVSALQIKLDQMREGLDKKPMALAVLNVSDNDLDPSSIDAFSKIVVEGKRIQVVQTASAFAGRGFGGSSLRIDSEPMTFGVASVRKSIACFVASEEDPKGSVHEDGPPRQSSDGSSEEEDDDDYCPPPCADPYGEEDVTPSVALERQASRAALHTHNDSDDDTDKRKRNNDEHSDVDAAAVNSDNDDNAKSVASSQHRGSPSPTPAEGAKVTGLSLVPMLRYVSIWNRRTPADAQHLHSSLLFAIRRLVDEGFLDDFCVPALSNSLQTFFPASSNASAASQTSSITTALTNLLRSHGTPLIYTPPVLSTNVNGSSSGTPTSPHSDSSDTSASVAQGIHNALVAAERSLGMSAACTISLLTMLEEPGSVTSGDYIPIPDPNNLRPALAQAPSSAGFLQALMHRVEVNQILRRRLRRLRLKRRAHQEKLGEGNSLVPTFLQLFIEEQKKLTRALSELSMAAAGASTSGTAALTAAFNVSKIIKSILSKQQAAIAYFVTEFKVATKKEMGHRYIAAFPESQPNAADLTTMPYPPPAHATKAAALGGFSLDVDVVINALAKEYPVVYRDGVLITGVPTGTASSSAAHDNEDDEDMAAGRGGDVAPAEEEVPTYTPLEEDALLELTDPVEVAAMERLSRRLKAAIKLTNIAATSSAETAAGLPNFKLPPTTNEMGIRSTALASHDNAVSLGGLLSLLIPNTYTDVNNAAPVEPCTLAEIEWACLRNRLL